MHFLGLKDKYYYARRKRRYKKFHDLDLPFSFYDNKRDTLEYLTTDDKVNVESSIYESFSYLINFGFIYHYVVTYDILTTEGLKTKTEVCHNHNFEAIVHALYDYPESFNIPKKFQKEYSKQELLYLKKLQNFLRLIGLKDIRYTKERVNRCLKFNEIYDKKHKTLKDLIYIYKHDKWESKRHEKDKQERCYNKLARKYADYGYLYVKNPKMLAKMKKEGGYRIYLHHKYSSSRLDKYFFLMDEEENYHAILKVKEEKVIPFSELTKDMTSYKLLGYSSFKKYQEHLARKLKEDAKIYSETFSQGSKIIYLTYEVIKNLA